MRLCLGKSVEGSVVTQGVLLEILHFFSQDIAENRKRLVEFGLYSH
jgi:hypothetical protein